jgi:hypothetical protein
MKQAFQPFRVLFTLLLTLVLLSSSQSPSPNEIKILFVGNSLTYTNDLPILVATAAQKKGKLVTTEILAFPNYALEDHWNDGRVQTMIATGHYDYVIVQQGPSSQSNSRKMLLDYGQKFKNLCESNKSQLAFFMVWPAYVNYATFDGLIKNYTDAASETGSILCPVGKVWKQHFDETKDFGYYGPDMFHPSEKGSRVAAEVILNSLGL